jgi:hypothetical protein
MKTSLVDNDFRELHKKS